MLHRPGQLQENAYSINFKKFWYILTHLILLSKPLCLTLSNALEILRETHVTSKLESTTKNIVSTQELPGRERRLTERIFLVSKKRKLSWTYVFPITYRKFAVETLVGNFWLRIFFPHTVKMSRSDASSLRGLTALAFLVLAIYVRQQNPLGTQQV